MNSIPDGYHILIHGKHKIVSSSTTASIAQQICSCVRRLHGWLSVWLFHAGMYHTKQKAFSDEANQTALLPLRLVIVISRDVFY
jgi:hypothetical protein